MKPNKTLKRCDHFCKQDYIVEMNKVFKQNAHNYKIKYTRRPIEKHFDYTDCKKVFCNPMCKGYYNQKLRSGFQTRYTKRQVSKLKNRGALSGCSYISNYNVFH